MTDTTLRLLAHGGAIQLGDLLLTRQGADTVDKSITTDQLITFMDAHITVDAADLAGDTLADGILHSMLETVGTITAGEWQGTPIDDDYIVSADDWNAKISEITGFLVDGDNTTVSGTGTLLDPYAVNVPDVTFPVTSVSNSDGTITVTPTTGDVHVSLDLTHANTWSGQQTFNTSAIILGTTTANRALVTDAAKNVVSSAATDVEVGYLAGVTSLIQTQIDGKQPTGNYIIGLTGDITATGPGNANSAVSQIQGKAVSGTTGTANVMFSASPTTTGTMTAQAINASGAVSIGAALNMNSQLINNVLNPVSNQDAATKLYVDTVAQGLSAKPSAVLATAAALPACTYANGASGVGSTLTATGNGALTVDGTAVTTGMRIVVKNQVAALQNGVYTVTAPGSAGTPYVLTRAVDFDVPAEIPGAFVFVEIGTTNGATGWTVASAGPFTIGTTAIPWTQFSGAGTYLNGTGLTLTGNIFSITNTAVTAGTYGGASLIPIIVVNAQGQATGVSTIAVVAPAGTLTGNSLPAGVTASFLTSVGALTGGSAGAGFAINLSTVTLTGQVPAANVAGVMKNHPIGFSVLSPVVGQQGTFSITPQAGTITAWSIGIKGAGTVTIKVWKKATGTAVPTSADSINAAGLQLTTGTFIRSTTLTDFTTTTIAANDIWAYEITAVGAGVTGVFFGIEETPT